MEAGGAEASSAGEREPAHEMGVGDGQMEADAPPTLNPKTSVLAISSTPRRAATSSAIRR
jgi:hypothetical protein